MASGLQLNDALKNGVLRNFAPPPGPRAPPRFIHPPTPVQMEKPTPIVPDVSLLSMTSVGVSFQSNPDQEVDDDDSPDGDYFNFIPTPVSQNSSKNDTRNNLSRSRSLSKVDSGNGSLRSRFTTNDEDTSAASENLPDDRIIINASRNSESELPSYHYESLKADIGSVFNVVKCQAESIQNINAQLQQIITFQEKYFTQQITKVSKGSTFSNKSVQTDIQGFLHPAESPPEKRKQSSSESVKIKQGDMPRHSQVKKSTMDKEISSSNQSSTRKESQNDRQETLVSKNKKVATGTGTPEMDSKKTAADFSTVLRNLQISNVQGPSMYSETSMKSIECPPFNESFQNDSSVSIGPSASANGSDLEDNSEEVVPSVTYYNNLISTVNRILDGGQKQQATSLPTSDKRSKTQQNVKNIKGSNHISPGSGASSSEGSTASYSNFSIPLENEPHRLDDFKENNHPSRGAAGGICEANSFVNKVLQQQPQKNLENSNTNRDDYGYGGGDSVDSTKKYLQSLGVQFDGPTNQNYPQPPTTQQTLSQKQNYMIQQNVYNSIYIPTVNCVPMMPESFNSNSGLLDNLARKYIPSGERNQYDVDMLAGKRNDPGALAETTVYGMSAGNLSFATKQYLQRHGLVGQTEPQISSIPQNQAQALPPLNGRHNPRVTPTLAPELNGNKDDKILDMTAIRNQPKFL